VSVRFFLIETPQTKHQSNKTPRAREKPLRQTVLRRDIAIIMPGASEYGGRCGLVPPFSSGDGEGRESSVDLAILIAKCVAVWAVLWYACALVARLVLQSRLPPSKKANENRAVYIGQKLVATLKVILVSSLANHAVFSLWSRSVREQVASGIESEVAGLLFVSFEIADLVLGAGHGMLDALFIVHHLTHIGIGLIMRANCNNCFVAAILMAQVYQRHQRAPTTAAASPCKRPCAPLCTQSSPYGWRRRGRRPLASS
jgi:hypothetical protein